MRTTRRSSKRASAVISSQLDTAFPSRVSSQHVGVTRRRRRNERVGVYFAFHPPKHARAVQITRAPPAAASHIFDQKWGIHVGGGFDLRFTHDCVRSFFYPRFDHPVCRVCCVVSALLMHGRRESPPLVFSLSARERWIVTVVVPCSMYVEVHTRCNILLS